MDQLRDELTSPARPRARWRRSIRRLARGAAAASWLAGRVVLLAVVAAVAVGAVAGRDGAGAAAGRPERVTGGASSMDELIARFLEALRAGDRAALEALRLTREEYLRLVMPGHVPPGQPPQVLSPEAAEYFFGVMDAKSAHFREALISRFAGRPLEVREVGFEKGSAQYAGHRVHKRAALELRGEDGRVVELRTGSVVERDGRFKFASFIRD